MYPEDCAICKMSQRNDVGVLVLPSNTGTGWRHERGSHGPWSKAEHALIQLLVTISTSEQRSGMCESKCGLITTMSSVSRV